MSESDIGPGSYQQPAASYSNPLTHPPGTEATQQSQGTLEAKGPGQLSNAQIADVQTKSTAKKAEPTPATAGPQIQKPEVAMMVSAEVFFAYFLHLLAPQQTVQFEGANDPSISAAAAKSNFGNLEEKMAFGATLRRHPLIMDLEETKNEVISNMWEKFQEVIRQLDQQREAYIKSPAYQRKLHDASNAGQKLVERQTPESAKVIVDKGAASFAAYLNSLPPADKEQLISETRLILAGDVNRGAHLLKGAERSAATDLNGYENIAIADGAKAIAPSLLSGLHLTPEGRLHSHELVSNQVIDTTQLLNQQLSDPIHPLLAAELGLLGALLAQATMGREAIVNKVVCTALNPAEKQPDHVAYAKGCAQAFVGFVNGKGFDFAITQVLIEKAKASGLPLTPEQAKEAVNQLKVSILVLGLATLHQAQFGNAFGKGLTELIEQPELLERPPFQGVRDYMRALVTNIRIHLPEESSERREWLSHIEKEYERGDERQLLAPNSILAFENFSPSSSATSLPAGL